MVVSAVHVNHRSPAASFHNSAYEHLSLFSAILLRSLMRFLPPFVVFLPQKGEKSKKEHGGEEENTRGVHIREGGLLESSRYGERWEIDKRDERGTRER